MKIQFNFEVEISKEEINFLIKEEEKRDEERRHNRRCNNRRHNDYRNDNHYEKKNINDNYYR